MTITMLAGPLVGAVIGYFTNYLAVKMLFRPRHEIKIGGWTLPMTPGVIPKGKARLAKSVGRAVSDNLLTKEDLSKYLLNKETTDLVTDRVVDFLNQDIKDDLIVLTGTSEEAYEEKKDKAIEAVSGYLCDEIAKLPLKDQISGVIVDATKEKLMELASQGGMMAMVPMMLSEDAIKDLAGPMGWKAEKYINDHSHEYIQPVFKNKVDEIQEECVMDILNKFDLSDDKIREIVEGIYVGLVDDNIGRVVEHLDIAGIIESKINDMSVEELEVLVLSVMKKELSMIVSLGALIGFVIGIVNVFI